MSAQAPAAVLIGWQTFAVTDRADSVRREAERLAAYREAGILILHAQLLSLPTSTSRSWHALQEREAGLRFPLIGSPEAEFVPELRPLPNEPVVESYRASVFLDTRLPLLLRSNATRRVILSGPGMHTTILSSAVTAAGLDFEVVIASEAQPRQTPPVEAAALEVVRTWASVISEVELGGILKEHTA